MKKLFLPVVLSLLFAVPVFALNMQDMAAPMQGSTAAEGSHVWKFKNLDKIKVVWTASTTARYLCIFDATAVPSNGATTACSATWSTGCLAWAGYMPNSTSAPNEQWFDWGFWPLQNRFGTVAVVSTTSCDNITADGSNNWLYAQGE